MGWYSAVGRPLFFALPPEAAHRVARAALTLPLPWARIGHAGDDPSLATTLAGIPLRNPIGLAAGFDKTCSHLDALGALGFGYVVGGTITLEPRRGNPKPRIVRYPSRGSMANAMGLPNPGAERGAANMRRGRAVTPRLISLADEALDDALRALELLEPQADGIEVNASCPNVSWGRDRDNEAHLRELVSAIRARTPKPVFVKLPPFATPVERDVVLALVSVAQESGASGLTCSNTRPVKDARLSVGGGGLSGRALFERTPEIVSDVHAATGGAIPINACGGVSSGADALKCLEAGATTVQIYTALIYRGPAVAGSLARELSAALRARQGVLPSG
jgi:dihydroorotate dehydrogenase subfamily 2